MQRQRKATTFRLNVGFLPRPASEKSGLKFIPAKSAQGLMLAFGEKSFRQSLRLDFTVQVLHIYPDCPALHKSHKRQTVGVRDVEAQVAVTFMSRFSLSRVAEAHLLRTTSKIKSQQRAQGSASQNKFATRPFDAESACSILLLPRKQSVTCA